MVPYHLLFSIGELGAVPIGSMRWKGEGGEGGKDGEQRYAAKSGMMRAKRYQRWWERVIPVRQGQKGQWPDEVCVMGCRVGG